jgi:tetratricopeptide (TPR) repeat protein
MAKIAGSLYKEAVSLHLEAVCWQSLGRYSQCLSLLHKASHLLDLCGMSGGRVHSRIKTAQAEVHLCKSEYVEAHSIQTQILNESSMSQTPFEYALALVNIAQIDIEVGSSDSNVQGNLKTATLLFQSLNFPTGLLSCDTIRAALDIQQGNLPTARNIFQNCLSSAWGKDIGVLNYILETLGDVQRWCPFYQISFPSPVTFLAQSCKSKQRLEFHKALQFLGDVFLAQGDQDTASSLFTVALDGFTQMDVHRNRAECMLRLGDLARLSGDDLKAVDLWQTARVLFERSSQNKQVAHVEGKLVGLGHVWSQKVQEDVLSHPADIHASTRHPKESSNVESPNLEMVREIEDLCLEDDSTPVLV